MSVRKKKLYRAFIPGSADIYVWKSHVDSEFANNYKGSAN